MDQLREDLRNCLSPRDPSVDYDIASDARHEGTTLWFMACDAFKDWKASNSLLWIYGKRTSPRPYSSLWLMDVISIAGCGKSVLRFVTPQHHLTGIVDLPSVHPSFRIFAVLLTRVQPMSLTSSLISTTPESRIPSHYSLLFSSSSAINLTLSSTFSLPGIQPAHLAGRDRVAAHSHNASET